ncbi:MAG TPA: hypothetical protein VGJ00_00055 [Rhabdochlamydiaceae bacterium]
MISVKAKKVKNLIFNSCVTGLLVSSLAIPFPLRGNEEFLEEEIYFEKNEDSQGYCINFQDVPIIEFVRFVSRISEENFLFDSKDLDFHVSLSTGKSVSSAKVVQALIQLLKMHGLSVAYDAGYFVINKIGEAPLDYSGRNLEGLLASNSSSLPGLSQEKYEFFVYKLQYHEGEHIVDSLKKIAADLRSQPDAPLRLINAIQALQWVKATNSLLCSTDSDTLVKLRSLIEDLDQPLRQVFIEVLVVETEIKKGMEFGLQWAAGGQFQNKMGFGLGNFAPGSTGFAQTMQGINATNTPTGLDQIPLVPGFDLGVIGDIIMHKGKSYLSLGSLVSALQMDGNSTIVLNQKIITQDNKNSTIFVGDNIPFTGSVVQTIGSSQQTTANIEYRDVGVSLSITPRLGEGDIITLDINEEITETLEHDMINTANTANGIRTTKTNMVTHVHVPDKNFLVLSGMIRNHKARRKAGIPCLGGLPILGILFSKTKKEEDRRNVIIFVRPHIIHSFEDYNRLTKRQEEIYKEQAIPEDVDDALNVIPDRENKETK